MRDRQQQRAANACACHLIEWNKLGRAVFFPLMPSLEKAHGNSREKGRFLF